MRAGTWLVVLSGTALFVAGCASATPGTAEPATSGHSGDRHTPDTGNDYGAPRVARSLDTTKWQANPCTALTTAQLATLGVGQAGTLTPDPSGGVCDWSPQLDVHYGLGFNTQFQPGEAKGLGNDYEFARGTLRRLPDIEGQPAITQPSQNTDGNCTIYIGATDDIDYVTTVIISAGLPHYDDPCSVAEQLATDATTTMRTG